jgi:spermidine synthase
VTLLFTAGALSMIAQVVILRELVAALFGVELLYVLALGTWLTGAALGSAAGRHLPATRAVGVAGCILLGLLVPAELILIRTAGPTAGAVPGAYLPFPLQLAWIAALTLPPAAASGVLFPPLSALAARKAPGVGRSYAVESAGAAAAGVAVTLAMWLGASTLHLAVAAPAVALVAAAAGARRRTLAVWAAAIAISASAVALARNGRPWDLALLRSMYPAIVDALDTPYARIVITRTGSQLAVFENGALAFDTEGTSAEAFADLAAVQHPHPLRALVIGGGAEGVASALARHGIPVIHNLEIDERADRLARLHTVPDRRFGTGEGAVTVIYDEPRRFLDRPATYDLILVAAGEPASGASSRFYTREFFRQCARRLARGGIVAIRLAAAENVWPRPLARRTASIAAALQQEFSALQFVAGATLYLFASDSPLSSDPALLAGRLVERGVHPRLITGPYLNYLYTNDRREEVARVLAPTPPATPNRDAAPVCFQYAAMTWLAKFYPDLAAGSAGTGGVPSWAILFVAAIALGGALVWARRRPDRRIAAMLLGAGFIGMVLETLLLLRYQVRNGIVYQQIGWLLTCFMAGLTAGAYAFGERRHDGGLVPPIRGASAIPLMLLATTLVAWAAIAWLPATSGLPGTSALLLLAGLSVGTSMAMAGRLWQGDRRRAASTLYAADVAGGAVGAVIATLVLVPAAGLDGSALLMAASAAVLFLLSPRSGSGAR